MEHEKINYLELTAKDIDATKAFFRSVFNWTFTDYGDEYTAFAKADAGIDGGFFKGEETSTQITGGALIVFYSEALEQTLAKVRQAGGVICKDTFEFPGGRRFHFLEPSGNEFAVWSDK